jgi:hypothetical protein
VTSPLRLTTSIFFQLHTCGYSPYVTSYNCCWPSSAQSFSGPSPAGLILLSQIRDSTNLEVQVSIFISTKNRVAQLYPQALGSPFVASYDSQGYGSSIIACVFVAAGTCLPTCCPETGCVTPFIKNLLLCQGVLFRDRYPATGLQATTSINRRLSVLNYRYLSVQMRAVTVENCLRLVFSSNIDRNTTGERAPGTH